MKVEEAQKEPSMEEILSSIRRIISDDKPAQPVEEDDVLVLTDSMIERDTPMPARSAENSNVSTLPATDIPGAPFVPGAIEDEEVKEIPRPALEAGRKSSLLNPDIPAPSVAPSLAKDEGEEIESLLAPKVEQGAVAALAQLQKAVKPTPSPMVAASGGLLVETLVRSAIEPVLKDWLDQNLQQIVEQMVRREVERLGRKAEMGG